MKILYLMTEPFGYGGVQSDLLTLSQDLTARGHTVYVATTEGVLLAELKSRGAIHVNLDFRFREPLSLLRTSYALRQLIRRESIDLVAPQSVRSAIAAAFALRAIPMRRRPPIVVTIHNIHSPQHFGYVGHILHRCADFVIFESRYEHDRVIAGGLPATKAAIVHSGIDTDRFQPIAPSTELQRQYALETGSSPVFGIVARLSEEKGHHYLLNAFNTVRAQLPQARLLIIGDGTLREPLERQVKALGLQDRVTFTGSQRNVPQYLALLDVFVLSSTRESFPLAAREAMAAGKAVIAPNIGGCPEVVDDGVTGFLFQAANVPELAARMVAIAADGRFRTFGTAGRNRVVALFSRRSWVDGDERIYLEWMTRARRRSPGK
ncbi:MAG TPA: glycosyltransferase [Steroidobacteraceae bacterium]|nr:glycosyltransferase [Steroidobacteraceae bacterium]